MHGQGEVNLHLVFLTEQPLRIISLASSRKAKPSNFGEFLKTNLPSCYSNIIMEQVMTRCMVITICMKKWNR